MALVAQEQHSKGKPHNHCACFSGMRSENEVTMFPVESVYSELYSNWLYEIGKQAMIWGHDAMVSYLLEQEKVKYVDPDHRLNNCYRANECSDDNEIGEMRSFHDYAIKDRGLAPEGLDTTEVIEQDPEIFPYNDQWQLQHSWRASQGTQPEARVAFTSEGHTRGILDGVTDAQRHCCHWIESTPVSETTGLWLEGSNAKGKTALLKILMSRYDEQVFVLKKRVARGWPDDTSLIGRKPHHTLFLVNDRKGHESSRYYTRSWPMETPEYPLMLMEYFPTNFSWSGRIELEPWRCHMTVQGSDDREVLLRYVSRYSVNFSDQYKPVWAPPASEEFERRYDVVEIQEDGSYKLVNIRVPARVIWQRWLLHSIYNS